MKETELYLAGFAPLIQLWAGICLLFFYEGLLEKSPFAAYRDRIKSLYSNFTMKYLDFLSNKLPEGEEYIGIKWENFLPTIKNIAALSFLYSAFILAFIGIENHPPCKHLYCALQIMNICVCIYLTLSIIFIKSKLFHKYITSICIFVLLLVYFHFHTFINSIFIKNIGCLGTYFSQSGITVFTVFTCIGGILLILGRLSWDFLILKKREKSIKKIDKSFEYLTKVYMGQDKLSNLPRKIKKKIQKKILKQISEKNEVTKENLNKYITDEILEEFELFTISWLELQKKKIKNTIYRLKTFSKFTSLFF